MTELFNEIDKEMTDFIRADRRKPLGYYAKANIEETRDAVCWIQKLTRELNQTNVDAGGRKLLFEILDHSYRAVELIDDVLRSPTEKER